MRRYTAGLIAAFGLIIIIIFLIFHGGGKSKVSNTTKTLDSYATTDAEVELTIDGPIVADQNHQAIKIAVSNDSVTYQAIQGYQGSVIKEETYPNNVNAYTNFLFALERAGFTEGDNASDLKNNLGYCPLGDRYVLELNQDGQDIENYWSTSCGSPNTYKGNLSLTLTLFQDQVPNYSSLASNVNI